MWSIVIGAEQKWSTAYFLRKALYIPKDFFKHATSLDQAFAHCPRYSTAASRRSEARISMPLLAVMLSHRLPVIALVSHYLTNKLMGRRFVLFRHVCTYLYPLIALRDYRELANLSIGYAREWGWSLRVTNPSATIVPHYRSPLKIKNQKSKIKIKIQSSKIFFENFWYLNFTLWDLHFAFRECRTLVRHDRLTCMPYPRRQRSSWARIELSFKLRDNSQKPFVTQVK